MTNTVCRWDRFELALQGPAGGNPFTDVELSAWFWLENREVAAEGFYDGGGVYKLRFMPDALGKWQYCTVSNRPELDGLTGGFLCVEAAPGSHGPVRVSGTYHFAYEDGTAYLPFGTTCYAWTHQGVVLEELTLNTLQTSPFNKMRMCVFPKHYEFNENEPPLHGFERRPDGSFDLTRFHPPFFAHLERRVQDLMDMGIEADLILFHPYDKWGYATMGAEADDRYLRYVVARLASFRNVWWSFANEYDIMDKSMADWDRLIRLAQQKDPSDHLRSIHNCRGFYDHGKPWITHASVQHNDLYRVIDWRKGYGKPVVVDECSYEGNINKGWGNITAQEMVHRFWKGCMRGGYVGHGETYMHPEDILWWSKGGVLHGQSAGRIAFLREIMEAAPQGLEPIDIHWDTACVGKPGEYYLMYFGQRQPSFKVLSLPEGSGYKIDIIDTWGMTVTALPGIYRCGDRVDLPGKPCAAIRVVRV